MIRKDQLPRVWGDNWAVDDGCTATHINIEPGQSTQIVVTEDQWLAQQLEGKAQCIAPTQLLDIHLQQGASLQLYRLQGILTPKEYVCDTNITMQQDANLNMCTITLGGGHTRNNVAIRMQGEGCNVIANGLYLIDRSQECDNYIFVEHAKPHCISHELYKGIIDDSARARFNGHVLVQDGAVKTEAYQTNRNILLTDKAHVDTRPFLEIYNDDVKCSHGSTIGQLDEQAMFYLQTRGISQHTAMTMLSYAFCDEVIRQIEIATLRDIVGDMVKKRLHGELSPSCDECATPCSTPCNGENAGFKIDPTKL